MAKKKTSRSRGSVTEHRLASSLESLAAAAQTFIRMYAQQIAAQTALADSLHRLVNDMRSAGELVLPKLEEVLTNQNELAQLTIHSVGESKEGVTGITK